MLFYEFSVYVCVCDRNEFILQHENQQTKISIYIFVRCDKTVRKRSYINADVTIFNEAFTVRLSARLFRRNEKKREKSCSTENVLQTALKSQELIQSWEQ